MAGSPLDTLLSLHPQVFIVLLLEFLNSYRNFGLRSMVYTLCICSIARATRCGRHCSVAATIVTIFGFCGSVITDIIGVRRTAMLSICLSLIGRGMLAVNTATISPQKISLLGIHPIGEALLTTGLYRVALKKMTTEDTRPLAFAISYSVYNCAGGVANFVIDAFKNMPDITVFGAVYTGPRLFLATSWVALFIALLLVIFALKDVTVVEEGYEEEDRDGVELVSEATTDSSSTPAAAAAVADVHVPNTHHCAAAAMATMGANAASSAGCASAESVRSHAQEPCQQCFARRRECASLECSRISAALVPHAARSFSPLCATSSTCCNYVLYGAPCSWAWPALSLASHGASTRWSYRHSSSGR